MLILALLLLLMVMGADKIGMFTSNHEIEPGLLTPALKVENFQLP
jgi:hypothetical protein